MVAAITGRLSFEGAQCMQNYYSDIDSSRQRRVEFFISSMNCSSVTSEKRSGSPSPCKYVHTKQYAPIKDETQKNTCEPLFKKGVRGLCRV